MARIERLSEADHALVSAAVGAAERDTDGEIVTIVAPASDDYRETPFHWGLAALFLYLASLAIVPQWHLAALTFIAGGWEHEYRPAEYLAMILVVALVKFFAVYALVGFWPVRLLLTPGPVKAARVRTRAIALFRVGAEQRTQGLTGILIYLSMAEHRAEIVADAAIAAKVDPAVWGDAMAALVGEVRAGRPGAGMAAAVAAVGIVLAEHFPKSVDNPNELPDRLIEL